MWVATNPAKFNILHDCNVFLLHWFSLGRLTLRTTNIPLSCNYDGSDEAIIFIFNLIYIIYTCI